MPTSLIVQEARRLSVATPLDFDALLIRGFRGTEGLSRLYRFDVELLLDRHDGLHHQRSLDDLLGNDMTITVQPEEGEEGPRHLHGIVRSLRRAGATERFVFYHAEVVPSLWRLTLSSDCRVYQGRTAPQIVLEVLAAQGIEHVRSELTRDYPRWDTCVQYNETHLDFLSRLMEHEGVHYFFRHEEGRHTLVLADAPSSYKPCPGLGALHFDIDQERGEPGATVTSWETEHALISGVLATRDFHFEMPDHPLETHEPSVVRLGGVLAHERFEYRPDAAPRFNLAGERLAEVPKEAQRLTRLRMEEQEQRHHTFRGASDCRKLAVGHQFEFGAEGGLHSAEKGRFVVTSLTHVARQSPDYVSGLPTEGYKNE